MKSSRWSLAAAVLCVLFTGALLIAQEGRRARGTLPPGYGKLGLSDEQKQRVYTIQAKYKAQIDDLEEQLKKVRISQRREVESVLTPAQKARFKELALEKLPEDNGNKIEKKK